jgi:hypothetical protein
MLKRMAKISGNGLARQSADRSGQPDLHHQVLIPNDEHRLKAAYSPAFGADACG